MLALEIQYVIDLNVWIAAKGGGWRGPPVSVEALNKI